MPQPRECPKCGGSMAEGFVLDRSHGAMTLSTWVEGPAEKSVWTGVKTSGRGQSDIATWRCTRCGFLESYAPGAPDGRGEAAANRSAATITAIAVAAVLLLVLVGVYLGHRAH